MKQNPSIIPEHPHPSFWNTYPPKDIATIQMKVDIHPDLEN